MTDPTHQEDSQIDKALGEDWPVKGEGVMALLTPASCYWKKPFRYDAEGSVVWDANNARIVDVRGWGHLTGKGAYGLDAGEATLIQDQLGAAIVLLLNAHWPAAK